MTAPVRRQPRKCKPSTYVRVAQRLLRTTPRAEVSAGQVAYHAHGKTPFACQRDFEADRALSDSGLFERANSPGSDVPVWRTKKVSL
jgi:hypothetical protein